MERDQDVLAVQTALARFPVVGIIGARQAGKTTLARAVAKRHNGPVTHFDLEDTADLARLADPRLALGDLRGLIVLDEIQRRPEIFPTLRVLADRRPRRVRFLVLGSASPDLLRQGSESLAGRIHYHELKGLSLFDVGRTRLKRLWLRGGFPRSFLARSETESVAWRRALIRRFLERDLPQLGVQIPAETLRRFWTMVAHVHGQTWNASEFGRAFGMADTTVRRYLDLLTATFLVRQLQPFHENLAKRQVKAPKLYVSDSGLLHSLLGLQDERDLEGHPKVGASWEGFALDQVVRHMGARAEDCYFWATHAGAELDLLIVRGRRRWGFEVKKTSAPGLTRSMHIAIEDLRLDRLDVIHAGRDTFALAAKVRAVALADVTSSGHRVIG
jgi:predicted AAA+ superfamily ATPase